jgi:hypothetical protein
VSERFTIQAVPTLDLELIKTRTFSQVVYLRYRQT